MSDEWDVRDDLAEEPIVQDSSQPPSETASVVGEVEVGELSGELMTSPSSETLWQQMRRRLFPTEQERAEQTLERLDAFNRAIRQFPDSATNYVLRGEIYLETGAYEPAIRDFEMALERAAAAAERDDWGILAQAMQDRAEAGLKQARHLFGQTRDAL